MVLSPSYTWSETASELTLRVRCPTARGGTDVYSSPHYVSLNAPPYFLELDLHGTISPSYSVASVGGGVVTLRMRKAEPGMWGQLLVELARPERLKRRAASRAAAEKDAKALEERKKAKTWNESRYTLQEQMDADRASREAIEQAKAKEKAAEAEKLLHWQQSVSTPQPTPRAPAPPASASATATRVRVPAPIFDEDDDDGPRIVEIDDAPPLLDEVTAPPTSGRPARSAVPPPPPVKPTQPAPPPLPPPRSTGAVSIKFTPKLLPAPARTKGAQADMALPPDPLVAPGLASSASADDGDISQRDPAWLKARGDRFFCGRDWASAESAYTHVLDQFGHAIMGQAIDCVVGCYSNRAACRLQMNKALRAADDATQALGIMCKARCVTEFPKSEAELQRRRLRLYARRAAAYARAGVLHRAATDLHHAAALVGDSSDPSAFSDAQMLQCDLAAVGERETKAAALRDEAAELLAKHQRRSSGACVDGEDEDLDDESIAELERARILLDESLALQAADAPTLANRAACNLWLGQAKPCLADTNAGLQELDAEEARTSADGSMLSGMFPASPPPEPVAAALRARSDAAPAVRFELLTRRAAAHTKLGQLPAAATDLKSALKLRPGDVRVIHSLDLLARRAAAAGVELEPLPPAPPPLPEVPAKGGESPNEKEQADEMDGATPEGQVATVAPPKLAVDSKPVVGTRTAAQIKKDADTAVQAGKLERAVGLYGEALKADASAEWLLGAAVGGLLFRCQCLANRAACQLRLRQFSSCVDDSTAALAALGNDVVEPAMRALRLKLLARRGMALCQMMRYDEASADYAAAVDMDPNDEQLKHDLEAIEAARKQTHG